jgi:hypothetical protein
VTRGRYTALTQDHGFHGVGMHEFTRGDLVVSGGGALSHYGDRWMGLGIGGCGIVDAGIGVQNVKFEPVTDTTAGGRVKDCVKEVLQGGEDHNAAD